MKFGVVVFPGSNCDHDMIYLLRKILKQDVVELWHKDTLGVDECDCIVLPGGFSYGDYLRSGALARYSPIMEKVIEFANKGGYVVGVCNGFQILCESHLLPGALLHNNTQKFICKNIYIKPVTTDTAWTKKCKKDKALKVPIAHGEGRYFADEATIKSLVENDQILFQYCDAKGAVTEEANPNGSLQNIAGVCNAKRNVFGMMPHPERCADADLKNEDGRILFESLIKTFTKNA